MSALRKKTDGLSSVGSSDTVAVQRNSTEILNFRYPVFALIVPDYQQVVAANRRAASKKSSQFFEILDELSCHVVSEKDSFHPILWIYLGK